MRDKRLMFDFGGVIADSEVLANRALAEIVSERDVSTNSLLAFRAYSPHEDLISESLASPACASAA